MIAAGGDGMGRVLVGLAALAAIVVGVWWFVLRDGANGAASSGDVAFETAVVDRGDVAQIVSASGSVRALTTVEVGSQLSGQVLELFADFNSEVEEGQVIARIDPQTFETRVQSARAEVTSAEANLAVQQASIRRAEANLAQIERDFARQTALYAEDAIALSLLEETERQLTVATADLELNKAQLQSAQASLIQRRASLESAEVDLDRTIIRSPITGVVIERNVDVGQTVAASFSAPVLFRIAQDLGDIRIDAAVVEADIGGIDPGDPAEFSVDAYPDDTFRGEVEQVRLSAQELQNVVTYTVVIAAQNPRGRLLPGMTANVEITADQREGVLRVAETATRFRPPDGVAVASSNGNGRGGGGFGGPGGGNPADELLAEIGVEQSRRTAISAQLRAEVQAVFQSAGQAAQTFDRARLRQQIQTRTDRVLRDELSEEEYDAYQSALNARASTRRVELYAQGEDGALTRTPVVIGLSDGENAEILRGANEGDAFVTRVRRSGPGA